MSLSRAQGLYARLAKLTKLPYPRAWLGLQPQRSLFRRSSAIVRETLDFLSGVQEEGRREEREKGRKNLAYIQRETSHLDVRRQSNQVKVTLVENSSDI